MKGTLATQILDGVIDFTALMRKLMQIVFAAVITQSVDKNPDDKSIGNEELAALIQHSLDLLLPCVMWQPGLLLKEIYQFPELEQLLIRSLMHNSDQNARKAVERTFRMICKKFNNEQNQSP